jgi:hypothetical protein
MINKFKRLLPESLKFSSGKKMKNPMFEKELQEEFFLKFHRENYPKDLNFLSK